ncbi:MAG: long-chain fatty acid--CoA ligase [Dinoroseobacter sp.]|nr:long-chain fatty acid--CoA ligase [Dinoroseobacter sp.]
MLETPISVDTAGTLFGLLRERARRSPDKIAFREFDRAQRDWIGLSWRQILQRAEKLADVFSSLGLEPGDRVAILIGNSVDWVTFDMAAHKRGLPVVGLYASDTPANIAYVISDARPRVVLVETDAQWAEIEKHLPDRSFLTEVWIRNPGQRMQPLTRSPIALFSEVLKRDVPMHEDMMLDPAATAALVYTSGTTGNPKGAMLSHRAILANAEATREVVPPGLEDVFLSILPLTHAFERTLGYVLPVMTGSCVAYAQSLLRVRQDLATIRPTVIIAVPRLYESILVAARRESAASPLKSAMLERTAKIGWRRFAARAGVGPGPNVFERLIWPVLNGLVVRKVKKSFGGRLRIAVSGGAAIAREMGQDLVGLGVPLVEGYGLTEAGPVVSGSLLDDYLPGSVGYALPGISVKLSDASEILVRSPSLMSGYWEGLDQTAETIDADGWLATGDLGELRDDRLYVTGRLKNLLVMSNGENVNPEPIEAALDANSLFSATCVVGDGQSFLSAVVVLNREVWHDLAVDSRLDEKAPNASASADVIMDQIKGCLKHLPAHQQIRAYHADFEDWLPENGLVTPTLKVRRPQVLAHYQKEVAAIYGIDDARGTSAGTSR